jgi:VanZ family protein
MLDLLALPVVYRCLISLAFAGLIIVLSVTPGHSQTGDSGFVWSVATTPTAIQKLMHVITYALLAGLLMWSLESVNQVAVRVGLVLLITVCLGVALEWYQTLVPGRFGTFADTVLNAIGSVVGIIAAVFLL